MYISVVPIFKAERRTRMMATSWQLFDMLKKKNKNKVVKAETMSYREIGNEA